MLEIWPHLLAAISSPHYSNFSADKSKDSSPPTDKKEYFRRKVMQVMYAAVRTRLDVLIDTVVLAGRAEVSPNSYKACIALNFA